MSEDLADKVDAALDPRKSLREREAAIVELNREHDPTAVRDQLRVSTQRR